MTASGKVSRAEVKRQRQDQILQAGRRQLMAHGAAGISLREVARDLGVVSSAVYRHVASRDELLTLLLVDAYDGLADHVDAALKRVQSTGPEARIVALAQEMRSWALQHPEQWGLIYGAPVPGYEAPASATSAPGGRVMHRLALEVSTLRVPESTPQENLGRFVEAGLDELGVNATPGAGVLAVQLWCTVVGTISMELFGQLGPEIRNSPAGKELLQNTVRTLIGMSAH